MSHAARKEQFYYQLATLLDSGLSIQSSIDHLQQQRGNAMHLLAAGLQRGVGEGMTLGDALKTYGGDEADPLDVATLRAAERGGKIEQGAKHLAEYYQLQAKLWQQIKAAMAYPLLVLHAAILLPAITVRVGLADCFERWEFRCSSLMRLLEHFGLEGASSIVRLLGTKVLTDCLVPFHLSGRSGKSFPFHDSARCSKSNCKPAVRFRKPSNPPGWRPALLA